MKRLTLILIVSGFILPLVRADDKAAVDGLIKQAQVAMTAGKFDDALQSYEQIISTHPEASERWYNAQIGITQALIKKGDFDNAAKSAHLCLDAAPLSVYDSQVAMVASILSAQDKNVARANQFIAFEQSGGGSGQTNPLDAVGYPIQPQRETAFATVREQAGDDSAASQLRGLTFIFTGHPKEALAQYADALRRADNTESKLHQAITDLVEIGLRDVRGHRVGLDEAIQFVIWGPMGPDGKAGTADDLSDPFAQWFPATPAPGEGGVTGFNAAELATLNQVRNAAQLYGGDPFLTTDIRHNALLALQRVTGALDGWGAPGQMDWYLSRAFPPSSASPDSEILSLLLQGGELAARGRNLHLGGIHDFWHELDTKITPGTPENKLIGPIRTQFDKLCNQLSQTKFPPSGFKPLQVPATF